MRLLLLAPLLLPSHQAPDAAPTPVEVLRGEAERVLALVECRGTRAFLGAVRALPEPEPRVLFADAQKGTYLTPEQHARLAPDEQERFQPTTFEARFHYSTRYGSPLAYARMLDVVGRQLGTADDDVLSGKRVLDFGYGGIGHLHLLARLGCDAVGVDVDRQLGAYYRPEDQGRIAGLDGGADGSLRLVTGRWPVDETVRAAVGEGYDLVLSKNVLKQGYVRPAQEVDPRLLVDLGVPPAEFLAAVARILKPGGVLAIYNLCPAPRADRYLPWAYGRSPFTRDELAAAGFELLAFDVEDRSQAIELGYALRWDEQGTRVEDDLFAWYTVARRRP